MKKLILLISTVVSMTATASELDRNVYNQEGNGLEGTTIFKVDTESNEVQVLQTSQTVESEADIAAIVDGANFEAVPQGNLVSELDREGASQSWYFYWNYSYSSYSYNYTPYYYYNNYYYQPSYTYRPHRSRYNYYCYDYYSYRRSYRRW